MIVSNSGANHDCNTKHDLIESVRRWKVRNESVIMVTIHDMESAHTVHNCTEGMNLDTLGSASCTAGIVKHDNIILSELVQFNGLGALLACFNHLSKGEDIDAKVLTLLLILLVVRVNIEQDDVPDGLCLA